MLAEHPAGPFLLHVSDIRALHDDVEFLGYNMSLDGNAWACPAWDALAKMEAEIDRIWSGEDKRVDAVVKYIHSYVAGHRCWDPCDAFYTLRHILPWYFPKHETQRALAVVDSLLS